MNLEVGLKLADFVEDGLGVSERHGGPFVRRAADDVLADHDHGEHHELDECLADPLDQGQKPPTNRFGKDQQREQRKGRRTTWCRSRS